SGYDRSARRKCFYGWTLNLPAPDVVARPRPPGPGRATRPGPISRLVMRGEGADGNGPPQPGATPAPGPRGRPPRPGAAPGPPPRLPLPPGPAPDRAPASGESRPRGPRPGLFPGRVPQLGALPGDDGGRAAGLAAAHPGRPDRRPAPPLSRQPAP